MKIKTLVVALVLVIGLGAVGHNETHYDRKATVVKVKGNEVLTQDAEGNQFSFYGNGFRKNEKLILKMNNKGTTKISDDEVLDAIRK